MIRRAGNDRPERTMGLLDVATGAANPIGAVAGAAGALAGGIAKKYAAGHGVDDPLGKLKEITGVGGIVETVEQTIAKFKSKIQSGLDVLVGKVKGFVEGLLGAIGGLVARAGTAVASTLARIGTFIELVRTHTRHAEAQAALVLMLGQGLFSASTGFFQVLLVRSAGLRALGTSLLASYLGTAAAMRASVAGPRNSDPKPPPPRLLAAAFGAATGLAVLAEQKARFILERATVFRMMAVEHYTSVMLESEARRRQSEEFYARTRTEGASFLMAFPIMLAQAATWAAGSASEFAAWVGQKIGGAASHLNPVALMGYVSTAIAEGLGKVASIQAAIAAKRSEAGQFVLGQAAWFARTGMQVVEQIAGSLSWHLRVLRGTVLHLKLFKSFLKANVKEFKAGSKGLRSGQKLLIKGFKADMRLLAIWTAAEKFANAIFKAKSLPFDVLKKFAPPKAPGLLPPMLPEGPVVSGDNVAPPGLLLGSGAPGQASGPDEPSGQGPGLGPAAPEEDPSGENQESGAQKDEEALLQQAGPAEKLQSAPEDQVAANPEGQPGSEKVGRESAPLDAPQEAKDAREGKPLESTQETKGAPDGGETAQEGQPKPKIARLPERALATPRPPLDAQEGPVSDGGLTGPYYPSRYGGPYFGTAQEAAGNRSRIAFYVNGVQTAIETHRRAAQSLAFQINKPVVGIYNATEGAADFAQAMTDKIGVGGLGMRNPATVTLANIVAQQGSPSDEKGGLDLYGHSQGSIIISEALRQARNRGSSLSNVEVTTFGNAAWTMPRGLKDQHHYVFDSDPVSASVGSSGYLATLARSRIGRGAMGAMGLQSTSDDTTTLHHSGQGIRPHSVVAEEGDSGPSYISSLGKFREQEARTRAKRRAGVVGGFSLPGRSTAATGMALARKAGSAAAGAVEGGYNRLASGVSALMGSSLAPAAAQSLWGTADAGMRAIGGGILSLGAGLAAGADRFFGIANLLQREGKGPQSEVDPAALRASLVKDGGSGMPVSMRTAMELGPYVQFDPSRARVHVGPAAEQAASQLQAKAFTIGSDVFFGAGQFQPESASGKALIAHELTHVAQQTGGRTLKSDGTAASGDALEAQARSAQEMVLADLGGAEGLIVDRLQMNYHAAETARISPEIERRLDAIGERALVVAGEMLEARDIQTGQRLEEVRVDVSLALDRQTDAQAAEVWAEAIVAQVSGAASSSSVLPRVQLAPNDPPPAAPPPAPTPGAAPPTAQAADPADPKKVKRSIVKTLDFMIKSDADWVKSILRDDNMMLFMMSLERLFKIFEKWQQFDLDWEKATGYLDYQYLDRWLFQLHQQVFEIDVFGPNHWTNAYDEIWFKSPDKFKSKLRAYTEKGALFGSTGPTSEEFEGMGSYVGKRVGYGVANVAMSMGEGLASTADMLLTRSEPVIENGKLVWKTSNPGFGEYVGKQKEEASKILGEALGIDPEKETTIFGISLKDWTNAGGKVIWGLTMAGKMQGMGAAGGTQAAIATAIGLKMTIVQADQLVDRIKKLRSEGKSWGDIVSDPETITMAAGVLAGAIGAGGAAAGSNAQLARDLARLGLVANATQGVAIANEIHAIANDDSLTDDEKRSKITSKAADLLVTAATTANDAFQMHTQAKAAARAQADAQKQLGAGPDPPKQLEAGPPPPKQLEAGPEPPKQLEAGPPPPKQLEAGEPQAKKTKAPETPAKVSPEEAAKKSLDDFQKNPTQESAEQAIRDIADWRGKIHELESKGVPKEHLDALQAAREQMRLQAQEAVRANPEFADIRFMFEGTKKLGSDIDIGVLPPDVSKLDTPEAVASALDRCARAAEALNAELARRGGGPPDTALDANVYPWTGVDAPIKIPIEQQAAVTKAWDVGSMAELQRASPEALQAIRQQLIEKTQTKGSKSRSEAAMEAQFLKAIDERIAQAQQITKGLGDEVQAEMQRLSKDEPTLNDKARQIKASEVVERRIRAKLVEALGKKPVDYAVVAKLQSQMLMLAPGAYATRGGIEDVVLLQQPLTKDPAKWLEGRGAVGMAEFAQSAMSSLANFEAHLHAPGTKAQADDLVKQAYKYGKRIEFDAYLAQMAGKDGKHPQRPEMMNRSRDPEQLTKMVEEWAGKNGVKGTYEEKAYAYAKDVQKWAQKTVGEMMVRSVTGQVVNPVRPPSIPPERKDPPGGSEPPTPPTPPSVPKAAGGGDDVGAAAMIVQGGGSTSVADTMVGRAADMAATTGIPKEQVRLQSIVDQLEAMGIGPEMVFTKASAFELGVKGVEGAIPTVKGEAMQVWERAALEWHLEQQGIGSSAKDQAKSAKGVGDQQVILQALESVPRGEEAKLISADDQVIKGLARIAGYDPNQMPGEGSFMNRLISQTGSNEFVVEFPGGRTLRVIGIQEISPQNLAKIRESREKEDDEN